MRKTKIIMHTHWDREWYFTKEETQVLLENQMREVFKFLEENPNAKYMLDGQTVMIDDLLEINQELEIPLKRFIANGQIQVGPWYTQTDLMIVSGESIIRNLQTGIKQALKYTDKPMLVGYAPDTFGHNANMPQIYRQFGINSTVFWRGFSELKAQKSDFTWQGIDGSKITGINLATGYQGAKYLETDKLDLEARIKKIYRVLDKYSATDNRLIMNGHDQMPIQLTINEVIANLKEIYPDDDYEISTLEAYINEMKNCQLELVEGELIHSKHARIHKTINSTRMDIKNLNAEIENKLFNQLEPLMVYLSSYQIPYPHQLIDKVLKILFGCHAHDSIGGCNSDKVNQDIKQRLLQVNELINTTINLSLRKLAMSITENDDTKLVVVNPFCYNQENSSCTMEILTQSDQFNLYHQGELLNYSIVNQQKISAGMIDRQIAARQKDYELYKSEIKINLGPITAMEHVVIDLKEEPRINPVYKTPVITLEVKSNQLNLRGSKNIDEIIKLEALYDAGDSYDYSPPHNLTQEILTKTNFNYSLVTTTINPVEIHYQIKVNDKNKFVKSNFLLDVFINQESENIDIKLKTNNQDKNTKIRVVINPDEKFTTITSGNQLSEITRPIENNQELAVWQQENWAEKPVAIETMQDYVRTQKMGIIAPTAKEYEVIKNPEPKIAITMYRTFDQLGKSNLVNRPGRPSGIEIPTPDNQLLNVDISLELKIIFNSKMTAKVAMESKQKLMGVKAEKVNSFNINFAKLEQISELKPKFILNDAIISAIKLDEENNYVVRLFNPSSVETTISLNMTCYLANLTETKFNSLEIEPQTIITLAANQIKTLIIPRVKL